MICWQDEPEGTMIDRTRSHLSARFNRRQFLQAAVIGTTGTVASRLVPPAWAAPASAVTIEAPFDGAILNHRDGKPTDGGLKIGVSGVVTLPGTVTINGQPARREGDRFSGEVVLREKVTEVIAAVHSEGGGEASARAKDRARVVWDRYSQPRYHFAVDDNIFFLRDIARQNYPCPSTTC